MDVRRWNGERGAARGPTPGAAVGACVRAVFPEDDVVLRAAGTVVLLLTALSVVPVVTSAVRGTGSLPLAVASSTVMLVAAVLVLARRRDLRRARAPLVVLVDLAALVFALSQVLGPAPGSWGKILPLLHILVTVLCALTMSRRAVRRQIALATCSAALLFTLTQPTWDTLWYLGDIVTGTLTVLVGLLVIAAAIRALAGRLSDAAAEAEDRARLDPLTGLLNRRGLERGLEPLVATARSTSADIDVVVADLDHFKRVNDAHGHATGDAVLVATATAVRRAVRSGDLTARLGGEEFVVLAPVTPTADRTALAQRIHRAVVDANALMGVTVSVGAVRRPAPPEGADPVTWFLAACADADRLLYRAKSAGRDRCVVEAPDGPAADRVPAIPESTDDGHGGGEGDRQDVPEEGRGPDIPTAPLGRLTAVAHRLFPGDDAVMRWTGVFVVAMAAVSPVPVVNAFTRNSGSPVLATACLAVLLAACVVMLRSRGHLRSAAAPVVVLLDVASVLFALGQTRGQVPSDWAMMGPVYLLLVTVLAALTLGPRALRAQVAYAVLASISIFVVATAEWRTPWQAVDALVGGLVVLVVLVSAAGSIRTLLSRLREALAEAERRSEHDALTGVLNRRGLEAAARGVVRGAWEAGRVGVLIADLDHFKAVNDTWGHATGDAVLAATARAVRDAVGPSGVVARLGGEEFVAVVPLGRDGEGEVAERVRRAINAAVAHLRVTVSIGALARAVPPPGTDTVQWLHRLIEEADDLLYAAKRAGRDRVVTQTPTAPGPVPGARPPAGHPVPTVPVT